MLDDHSPMIWNRISMGLRLSVWPFFSVLPSCSSPVHSYFQLIQMPIGGNFMASSTFPFRENHECGLLSLACFYRFSTIACPFGAFSLLSHLFLILSLKVLVGLLPNTHTHTYTFSKPTQTITFNPLAFLKVWSVRTICFRIFTRPED